MLSLRMAGWLAGMGLAALAALAVAGELPPGVDPRSGYRMENYRAPTPEVLPGGIVADFALVERAVRDGSYRLIDVYAGGVSTDPLTGRWIVVEPRRQIPGSVWLPGVGFGRLDPAQESFFRRNLDALTAGDKERGLLFYCMSDCWQSWNAARRAIGWGWRNVAWYPLGTDGWREHRGDFIAVQPPPFTAPGP